MALAVQALQGRDAATVLKHWACLLQICIHPKSLMMTEMEAGETKARSSSTVTRGTANFVASTGEEL